MCLKSFQGTTDVFTSGSNEFHRLWYCGILKSSHTCVSIPRTLRVIIWSYFSPLFRNKQGQLSFGWWEWTYIKLFHIYQLQWHRSISILMDITFFFIVPWFHLWTRTYQIQGFSSIYNIYYDCFKYSPLSIWILAIVLYTEKENRRNYTEIDGTIHQLKAVILWCGLHKMFVQYHKFHKFILNIIYFVKCSFWLFEASGTWDLKLTIFSPEQNLCVLG